MKTGVTATVGAVNSAIDTAAPIANRAVTATIDGAVKTVDTVVDGAKAGYSAVKSMGSSVIDSIMRIVSANGMTDPKEQAMFLAQLDHESGGFKQLSENLRYRPESLLKVFPKYFRTIDDAKAASKGGPETIANRVYGGRMGNKADGDGFKYRGRGFIQLTGHDNYSAASSALGIDLVNNPDLASQPETAAKIAQWFWNSRGLSKLAQKGDILNVTKHINGGVNGLDDRKSKFAKYMAMLPTTGNGESAAPSPIKSAMSGGWLGKMPTLVGEREPEVLDSNGRIFKDVNSFMSSATADVSGLAVSTAMKEATRRASGGTDTQGANAAFEKIAEAVSGNSGNSPKLEEIMAQVLGVLQTIAGNTSTLTDLKSLSDGGSNKNLSINATRNGGNNVFMTGGQQSTPAQTISPIMRTMMAAGN